MNCPRGQLLAGAILTRDQDRDRRFRGFCNQRPDVIHLRSCAQKVSLAVSFLNFLTKDLVFLEQFLLPGLELRKRLRVFQRDGRLSSQRFDKLLIFRHELSFLFVQNLEDARDLSAEVSERDAEDVARVIAGDGVDRRIEERRLVCIFDDQGLGRDEHRSGDAQARIEANGIGNAEGNLGPEFTFVLVQKEDRRPLRVEQFRRLDGDDVEQFVEVLFRVDPPGYLQ